MIALSPSNTFEVKKLLLLMLASFTIYVGWSQSCHQIAEDKISKIQDVSVDKDYQNIRAYDSLRKEMSITFALVENCAAKNPSYDARSKLKKVQLYYSMTALAGLIGKYPEMLKHIESMERLLPSPTTYSASSMNAFSISGTNYTANVSSSFVQSLYYQIIEQRVNYYYFSTQNYGKVVEWYDKLKAAPSDFKPSSLEALLYADAMYNAGKNGAEYFPAMAKAVALSGEQWIKKEEHDSASINNRKLMLGWFRREMNSYNKPKLNSADPTGNLRLLSARGLLNNDEKALAKDYALSGAENGASIKEDGFWYLDVLAENESKHIVGALTIIEKSLPSLTEDEMHRLLPLAEKHHVVPLEEGIRSRLRKILSVKRRSKITLYPAVELVGLPFGHVPVSLNLRTGRVLQEFMFDYVWGAKTKYRFGRIFAKGDKGDRYAFSGWDAGYSIRFILGRDFKQGNRKIGRSRFYSPAIGLDFRYAHWNFDPIVSNVLIHDQANTTSNVRVNATTTRYEICYRISFVTVTRFVTIDYYMGLGIGYRKLSTAEGYDVKRDQFEDPRLDANRWNKLYMPLRLGLKIGLNVL